METGKILLIIFIIICILWFVVCGRRTGSIYHGGALDAEDTSNKEIVEAIYKDFTTLINFETSDVETIVNKPLVNIKNETFYKNKVVDLSNLFRELRKYTKRTTKVKKLVGKNDFKSYVARLTNIIDHEGLYESIESYIFTLAGIASERIYINGVNAIAYTNGLRDDLREIETKFKKLIDELNGQSEINFKLGGLFSTKISSIDGPELLGNDVGVVFDPAYVIQDTTHLFKKVHMLFAPPVVGVVPSPPQPVVVVPPPPQPSQPPQIIINEIEPNYTASWLSLNSQLRHHSDDSVIDKIKYIILYRAAKDYADVFHQKQMLSEILPTHNTINDGRSQDKLEKLLGGFLDHENLPKQNGGSLQRFMNVLLSKPGDSVFHKLIFPAEINNPDLVFNKLI